MSVKLKKETVAAILSLLIAFIALCASAYAWFISNTKVTADTSSITAIANGMTLQIVKGTIPDHGKDSETIAFDSISGHEISPSSTDDVKTWYIPAAWTDGAMVSQYQAVAPDHETGEYVLNGRKYYAYCVGTYTLYTIRDTGVADIYLDGSTSEGAISVTSGGVPLNDKIAKSLRIGLATVDSSGVEKLQVVYAPSTPTGSGNDVHSKQNSLSGWIAVEDNSKTKNATYCHIAENNYIDQNAGNWGATKDGNDYRRPLDNPKAIASGIDYNGIILKVYIWLEGTDADCVNTSAEGIDEDMTFDVTLRMIGIDSAS